MINGMVGAGNVIVYTEPGGLVRRRVSFVCYCFGNIGTSIFSFFLCNSGYLVFTDCIPPFGCLLFWGHRSVWAWFAEGVIDGWPVTLLSWDLLHKWGSSVGAVP